LMMLAIDAGAEDFRLEDDFYEIYTKFEELDQVRSRLEEQGIHIENAEVTYIPQNTVHLEGKQAEQMIKLMEALEDNDDVQNVFANFDIDEEVLEKIEG
ncbi:MAG: YebC/PmpR family DNA-binding transcriptional regulator, partial [Calditrichaeota bacterium]